ncbi:MAG: TIGR01777 family oxidoreductase [Bacteroidales bacterium]
METVLLTGGTGLIGRHLGRKLAETGYNVIILSTRTGESYEFPVYHWDPANGKIDREAISAADYIIHLAGAGLADKRWTVKRKKLLISSRVTGGELLLKAVNRCDCKVKAFISISGTNYYGSLTSDRIFLETDPPADDFLGEVCRLWEQNADRFESAGIRSVKLRAGVVLASRGGALGRMIMPVKYGAGAPIGSGDQYLSWIHIDDLCGIFMKAIGDTAMRGTYNAVAPAQVTNREFMLTLANVMKRPAILPAIPARLMKLLYGEMSVVLLTGSRISSDKIRASGYKFRYPELKTALEDLLKISSGNPRFRTVP